MSIVLDVAIGVVLQFLLLALLVTTVQELVATVLGWRSANLYNAIDSMLTGSFRPPAVEAQAGQSAPSTANAPAPLDLVTQLYQHPLITNLVRCPSKLKDALSNLEKEASKLKSESSTIRKLNAEVRKYLPSYIPSKTFAVALLDILRGPNAEGISEGDLLKGAHATIAQINDPNLRRVLSLFVEKSEATGEELVKHLNRMRDGIEDWFNDRMARASGWYKRRAQLWSVIIAGLVVVVFNADTIHVTTRLWNDRALRDSMVAAAASLKVEEGGANSTGAKEQAEKLKQQSAALLNAGFPIGWHWVDSAPCARLVDPGPDSAAANQGESAQCWDATPGDRFLLFVGWLITALAVSLGSNFWFDVLGKALQLRGSGPKVSVSTGEVETKKA
ncbi:MAG TPA: hypothetical protein VFK05_23960 [Polyangiaceae bacterium]|nr:hypothetical protein [Polyangiaceae bacterium]